FLMGNVLLNASGGPVATWPKERKLTGKQLDGFAPCIGDANGDGDVEAYILHYRANIGGFDHTGNSIPGWPREGDEPSWFAPSMGNILHPGATTKQIVGAYGHKIFAWTWDGKSVPAADEAGVLVANVSSP